MNDSLVYVGIDNGLTGGITFLSPHGHIISKHVMPTFKTTRPYLKSEITQAKREGVILEGEKIIKEVDAKALLEIFGEYCFDRLHITFETCPWRSDQSSTMRSMALTAGKIIGALEIKYDRPDLIMSHDWQPVILGKFPKGKSKDFALEKCQELWKDESWLATSRSKVAHTGLLDSALIAEFCRRKFLTQTK